MVCSRRGDRKDPIAGKERGLMYKIKDLSYTSDRDELMLCDVMIWC